MAYRKRVMKGRAPRRAPKKSAKSVKSGRRRLMPGVAGPIVGYVGYRAYKTYAGYKAAKARVNKARQQANIAVSKNIVSIPAGLTVGKYVKPSLQQKIRDALEEPIMIKQTHAYKVNADSGRMNWFHSQSLSGGTLLQYFNKMRDSVSDGTVANPIIDEPASVPGSGTTPQQFYKHLIKYNSVQYQLVNSSTNSLKGVIMWIKPKRELPLASSTGAGVYVKPTNMFAASLNALKPTVDITNAGNFTQETASGGFAGLSTTLDYNRGGNSGTNNNSADNILETDVSLKPSSSVCKDYFGYYFDVVKSTDFDLAPGQQTEFWLKQHDRRTTLYQATQFDSIPEVTMYCMIGFMGQIVGTNAATGDVNVVSTGSAQLSIIENHKTLLKPVVNRAPKIWNYTNDTTDNGILVQIADASQEIINDETDGVDNTYNEVA